MGDDDDERSEHFRLAQKRLLEWADDSPLATFHISTGAQDWTTYTERVMTLIDEHAERWRAASEAS
jgi:hypothetical protein